MLEIRDLHKRFEGADVLRGVSLTIETGEFVTLLGPCLLYTSRCV